MLGPWLWVLLGLAALTTAAFIWLLLRQRGIARRLVFAQLLGLAGGALALVLMAKVSSSGFTDAAGPADWILITLGVCAGRHWCDHRHLHHPRLVQAQPQASGLKYPHFPPHQGTTHGADNRLRGHRF